MSGLSLTYQLPGAAWMFSVPSSDPLENSGPLRPVFEDLLADLRRDKIPKALQLTFEMPAAELQPGTVAALRAAWSRVIATRLHAEQQRQAELRYTRRRYLLQGFLILGACLTAGGLLGEQESTLMLTLAESLVICGWVAVWVPLERVFYTGWPLFREITILQRLGDCQPSFSASKAAH